MHEEKKWHAGVFKGFVHHFEKHALSFCVRSLKLALVLKSPMNLQAVSTCLVGTIHKGFLTICGTGTWTIPRRCIMVHRPRQSQLQAQQLSR